jgi:hypothetical protein
MTRARSDKGGADHGRRGDGGAGRQRAPRRSTAVKRATTTKPLLAAAVAVALASIAAGCGGSSRPSASGPGPAQGHRTSTRSSGVMAQALAYARCMRSHGLSDFPDPVAGPDGGITFQINGGPGSDLDRNDPRFKAANRSCRSLQPGGSQAGASGQAPISAGRLAAEVKWAGCMRSHGLPGFPDPNAQGAFDSSRFDDNSAGFQAATKACSPHEPAGPIVAVPGHGPA